MRPSRGLALVRRIQTTGRIGSIYIPPAAETRMTAQQVEIIAVGPPTLYDAEDPPEWVERQRETFIEGEATPGRLVLERPVDSRLAEGAWVILKSHRLLVTDQDDVFAVAQSDIVAVVDEV